MGSRSTSRKGQRLNEHAFCSQSLLPDLLSPMLERGSPRYDFINFSDFGEGWQRDTLADASKLRLQCLSIVLFLQRLCDLSGTRRLRFYAAINKSQKRIAFDRKK